jgi:hypothetical protein
MTQVVTLTLDQLNCIAEEDNPSSPYLWTAFLWIDETDRVQLRTPFESDDRVILSSNLQPGQSASIPPSVGVATYSVDNLGQAFIQVTALWQAHDFSANALQDGFKKFGTKLQSAIQDNLLGLASANPQTQQHATDEVEKTVHQAVYDAIWNGLTAVEKAMIGDGQIKLDSEIGTAYQVFRNIQPKQQFTITLGDLYRGRLLFYRDETQNGSGPVAGPSVIGDSGWGEFKFLFSGGGGIIYAVKGGKLLFYRDHNQDGTGNVASPNVIGAGWDEFKFVFSGGGKGIIYAAEQNPTHGYQIPGILQVTNS